MYDLHFLRTANFVIRIMISYSKPTYDKFRFFFFITFLLLLINITTNIFDKHMILCNLEFFKVLRKFLLKTAMRVL